MNDIAITLQDAGDDVSYLTLNLGLDGDTPLSLSLQDARAFAYALIQHVHLAEVRRSLKRAALRSV